VYGGVAWSAKGEWSLVPLSLSPLSHGQNVKLGYIMQLGWALDLVEHAGGVGAFALPGPVRPQRLLELRIARHALRRHRDTTPCRMAGVCARAEPFRQNPVASTSAVRG